MVKCYQIFNSSDNPIIQRAHLRMQSDLANALCAVGIIKLNLKEGERNQQTVKIITVREKSIDIRLSFTCRRELAIKIVQKSNTLGHKLCLKLKS